LTALTINWLRIIPAVTIIIGCRAIDITGCTEARKVRRK
jgi:hypothetical protein